MPKRTRSPEPGPSTSGVSGDLSTNVPPEAESDSDAESEEEEILKKKVQKDLEVLYGSVRDAHQSTTITEETRRYNVWICTTRRVFL